MSQIGMICEQGDMGLMFDPLSEKDQKVLKEQQVKNEDEKNKKKKSDYTYF